MNKIHNSKIGYPEIVYRYTVGKLPYMRIDNELEPINQSEYKWFSEMLLNKRFDLTVIEYLMIEKYFIERETIKEISIILGISYWSCRYKFEKVFRKLRVEICRHKRISERG